MTSLCIHGHFYQPPREDPNSDYIPDEIGAEPFRNWNEKILAECYWPNAEAGNFEKLASTLDQLFSGGLRNTHLILTN